MESFAAPMNACSLCGSRRIRPFARDFEGRTISRCRDCKIAFLNPQYTDEYLRTLYHAYPGVPFPDAERATPMDRGMREEAHHHYLSLVERFVAPGHLLAVGCGDGLELEVARSRGWAVEGCDVDEKTVRDLQGRGFAIRSGDLPTLDFGASRYECIYLHHVLEHPRAPQTYLQRIPGLLAPSGVLFIAAPNVGSLASRYKTFLSRAGLKKRPMKHYDTWHHLFFYTPRRLKRLLEDRYGYDVLLTRCGADDRKHHWSPSNQIARSFGSFTFLKSKFVLICTPRSQPAGRPR